MKCVIFAVALFAVAMAQPMQQCFPNVFQTRAEVYNHPGLFWDAGFWLDFTGQREFLLINPVPGNSPVHALLIVNGMGYELTGTPDENNGYTPTGCKSYPTPQMLGQCLNMSQWYGANVGGWGGMGGFKANIYTQGMNVNDSYTQSFMYKHGMNVVPTWLRQFNKTDGSYEDYNFYDSGNLKNASVFTVPSLCMGLEPKPDYVMSSPLAAVRRFWKSITM